MRIACKEGISVIIPVYNGERYIGRCLESLEAQDVKCDLEIIVVDNASTDGSRQVVERYSELDTRIKYLMEPTKGVSAARNAGLDASSRPLVTFLDADDYVSSDYLSTLLRYLDDEVDLVVSEAIDVDEDGTTRRLNRTKRVFDFALNYSYSPLAPYGHSTAWGVLYRQGIVGETRFNSDYSVGEDTLFYYDVLEKARLARHVPYRGYYYVIHATSAAHSQTAERYLSDIRAWQAVETVHSRSVMMTKIIKGFIAQRAARCYLSYIDACDDQAKALIESSLKKSWIDGIAVSLRRGQLRTLRDIVKARISLR